LFHQLYANARGIIFRSGRNQFWCGNILFLQMRYIFSDLMLCVHAALHYKSIAKNIRYEDLVKETLVSEIEPTPFRPTALGTSFHRTPQTAATKPVCFTRQELQTILAVYGRNVAAGTWRDYAIDMGREKAVFSIFRRSSEMPIYRVEKNPKLARKQGAFSIITPTGLILKRGTDLSRVLSAIDKRMKLV